MFSKNDTIKSQHFFSVIGSTTWPEMLCNLWVLLQLPSECLLWWHPKRSKDGGFIWWFCSCLTRVLDRFMFWWCVSAFPELFTLFVTCYVIVDNVLTCLIRRFPRKTWENKFIPFAKVRSISSFDQLTWPHFARVGILKMLFSKFSGTPRKQWHRLL